MSKARTIAVNVSNITAPAATLTSPEFSGNPTAPSPTLTLGIANKTYVDGLHATAIADSGVTAGTYGSATNIPVLAIDARGRVTSASTATVFIPSGDITIAGDVTGTGATGTTTTLTLSSTGVGAGTYKSVTVDTKGRVTAGTNPTTLSGYGITDALSSSGGTISGSLTVTGDLTVSGTTVTVNATNLALEDNMIYLNNGSTVSNPDLGFAGNYNDGTYKHAGMFRDASDGTWKFYQGYTLEPDASPYIDTTHASFALAPLAVSSLTATTLYGNLGSATTTYSGVVKATGSAARVVLPVGTNLYAT